MKVVIVEDEELIRELLIKIAVDVLGHKVVGEASDGERGYEVCCKRKPHLVLMDIKLPKMDGIELSKKLLSEFPKIRILTLSSGYDQFTLYRLFRSGVQGYVDKLTSSVDILKTAMQTVADGDVYFSDLALEIRDKMEADPKSFCKLLSEREIEMMLLFARGYINNEIADILGLSPLTVQAHRRSVMKKLNLHSAKELMCYAVEKGFWHPSNGQSVALEE